VTLGERGPAEVEVLPLKLDYCYTEAADGDEAAWIRARFTAACRALGTDVGERNGRLVVSFR
jgi:hypothetical protein